MSLMHAAGLPPGDVSVPGAPSAAPIQGSGGGQSAAPDANKPSKSGAFTNLNAYVSANKGNDMGVATVALRDYATRLASLQGAPITAANSASIAANIDGILADIATINAALSAAKFK